MNLRRFRFYTALYAGKLVYYLMKILNLDATTFPGKVALNIYPDFLKEISSKIKTRILVTGTNGKTTTNNLINYVIKRKGYRVIGNLEGANLKSGIATSYVKNSGIFDFATFEVDEGIFPYVYEDLSPHYVVITNFFRDQLDRYGEIDITVNKILNCLKENTILVLNADDPFVARFSKLPNKKFFFGIGTKIREGVEEIKESIYCPICGRKLNYDFFNYSQLGKYSCKCGFKNPDYDFYISSAIFNKEWNTEIFEKGEKYNLTFKYPGVYNLYNVLSAYSLLRVLNFDPLEISKFISEFEFRLGRLEKFIYKGFERILVLVKNPAGYNQVLDTIKDDKENKVLLLILNDNIADGRDVSWIWDVDFEKIKDLGEIQKIVVSGTRGEDLLVRLKYAEVPLEKVHLERDLKKAIDYSISFPYKTYILPTYTALFRSRKILMRKVKNGA
ncbi:Mur ligase family protein [Dictyoglomus thermophilum]|uniref:Lipid II isoglutaminyl synthase (glutamine-hydrolyzing) subunit MurT n=1 Tax=Dictyoglomus thermophilum (strain ATCC 35947 / DSM 3960 / H-6-12) TaxID=309799 RepID=B5YAQ9_DICT6|nr:Mur ligase family protein [Dictyoglomus thermophilum]ACI19935.1 Mur ligase family protein [Dictyoglomus thermophilum H-6-12]